MRLKLLFLTSILVCGFSVGSQAFAQVESTSILMHVVPENPNPGENVSVTLNSYAENLDTSSISWFVDGKSVSSGIGKKSIVVTAPTASGSTTVLAKITTSKSTTQVSTTIRSAEMILLWQAIDSYVPPFYKGKALAPAGTFIKVVAMPEIRTGSTMVDPTKLAYTWQKDFNNKPDDSGYGKNFFMYKNDYLDDSNNIGVTATTTDQKYSSQARMTVKTSAPLLSFYKEDSALGTVWEKTLENPHRIIGDEIVVAAPYFISPKDIRRPDLEFKWFINDVPISILNFVKNKIPLKVESGASGTSDLRLDISNKYQFYESVSKGIKVAF